MHSYGPVPVPQGDLTPDNILVSADGTAKISLFSFGRVIAAIPTAATLTASVGPLIPFRWMSPELLLSTSKPTAESDMWSLGCIGFWLLTGLRPYAGHLRDDFAGLENVSGIPPANITQIDFASGLGDHGRSADRDAPWITNGLWSTITRCWTVDPLLRPSARRFLDVLKGLEGRKHDWLPLDVADLAGKIAYVDPAENRNGPGKTRIARYITAWMHHRPGRGEAIKYYQVDMLLLRTTYNPNWYSKPMQVAIKHEFKYRAQDKLQDTRPFIPSIRHEITISAQLDHPNICKLIGIDTSHEDIPMMVFEYISDTTLEMRLKSELSFEDKVWLLNDITSAIVYLHEHTNGSIAYGNFSPANIYITSGGQAKLTNFTCAFQYATQPTQIPAPLSSIASGTRGGVSRWRSPEYNRECIPEEHVPLPTAPSDIWSLGCIILNMFVREHPFFKVPHQESIDQILAGVYPCEAPECASLDPRLLSLVRSMQSQDPAARPLAKDVSKVVSRLI
ncbi:Suppressor of Sensor Kinase (SLN1) [Ceratobasidium sp. 395]|nr:Suppressor of Sensor Kinase (SLN1) [Ceratobasidium sp. 395]